MGGSVETPIFAGGCFWGMQEMHHKREGVVSTRVGYTGGELPDAAQRRDDAVAPGWDPTTKDQQGDEAGTNVRSEVFCTRERQRLVAEETIADVDASRVWPGKALTAVSDAGRLWAAEPDHQDYYQRNSTATMCHYPRTGWRLPRRQPAGSATAG